ncbi:MAG: hypothetical protein EU530_09200 [Promethearchaeota archaeon]|nr:MAG: hypothetical protein EU530_09200 [Candidatus Lokiarchaeota archaeon]
MNNNNRDDLEEKPEIPRSVNNKKKNAFIKRNSKILTLSSFLVGNIGLSSLLGYSVPVQYGYSIDSYPFTRIYFTFTSLPLILIQAGWVRVVQKRITPKKDRNRSVRLLIEIFGILAGIFGYIIGIYYGFSKFSPLGMSLPYSVYSNKHSKKRVKKNKKKSNGLFF